MEDTMKKTEAARMFKVSLPTLNKFLKQHSELLVDGKVNLRKLAEWMEVESGFSTLKRGN